MGAELVARRFRLGGELVDLTRRALVMGIVNRTPDSFFDNGSHFSLDASLEHAQRLVSEGADVIDVGGVRAGPGEPVSLTEELDRVIPFVEAFTKHSDVPVSVDTWSAEVARQAFCAGAVIGNDISGFSDPEYLTVAAKAGASVVATHIRLAPRVNDPDPRYDNDDVVSAVESYLSERLARAHDAGLSSEQVLLDAGLDLGKTTEQSAQLLASSWRLCALGAPLLLSCSNKGFLGELFGLLVDERREATLAALSLGLALGARVVRVHDVVGARRIVNTFEHLWAAM